MTSIDLDELTRREREVMRLVAKGCSNRAIAEELVVSERTVESHIASIFMRLKLFGSPSSHRRVIAAVAWARAVRETVEGPRSA